jgi:hypothetical protein
LFLTDIEAACEKPEFLDLCLLLQHLKLLLHFCLCIPSVEAYVCLQPPLFKWNEKILCRDMAHVYAHPASALHGKGSVPWEIEAETATLVVSEEHNQQLRDTCFNLHSFGIVSEDLDHGVVLTLVLNAIDEWCLRSHPVPTDALVKIVGDETHIVTSYDWVHIPMAAFCDALQDVINLPVDHAVLLDARMKVQAPELQNVSNLLPRPLAQRRVLPLQIPASCLGQAPERVWRRVKHARKFHGFVPLDNSFVE